MVAQSKTQPGTLDMSVNFQEKLEKLENDFATNEISETDYKRSRWHLLQEAKEQQATVTPVYKGERPRETTDSMGSTYCYIPAGSFMFGEENEYSELPAGIYIAKHPVTVKEFMEFLEKSDWDYPEEDLEQMRVASPQEDCPVSYISWLDAKEYCRWLRKHTGEYYSLPTEEEWELASRGPDGRPFPWGYDELDGTLACYDGEKHYDATVPLGSFPNNISPFGCVEMVGNVWEFCIDEVDDPRNPHILRGGSWCNDSGFANCLSTTFCYPPEKRVNYGGFRIVFLPPDMLEEYRNAMEYEIIEPEPREQSKPGLNVICAAPEEPEGAPVAQEEPPPGRKALKKLGAAPPAPAAAPTPTASPERSRPNVDARGRRSTELKQVKAFDKSDLAEMGVKFKRKDSADEKALQTAANATSSDSGKGARAIPGEKSEPPPPKQVVRMTEAGAEVVPDTSSDRRKTGDTTTTKMTTAAYTVLGLWFGLLVIVLLLFGYNILNR